MNLCDDYYIDEFQLYIYSSPKTYLPKSSHLKLGDTKFELLISNPIKYPKYLKLISIKRKFKYDKD